MLDAIFSQVKQEKEINMTPSIPNRPTKPNGEIVSNLCSKLVFDGSKESEINLPKSPIKEFASKIDDASDDDDVSFDDVFGPSESEKSDEKSEKLDEKSDEKEENNGEKEQTTKSEKVDTENVENDEIEHEETPKAEISSDENPVENDNNINDKNLQHSEEVSESNIESLKHKAWVRISYLFMGIL